MFQNQVHFIGSRYRHHAQHSGYEGFTRYVGTALRPPVKFRWTHGRLGWRLDEFIVTLTRHPWYSLGAHLVEEAALLHMLSHRKRLYHILYGDSDLWLLRLINKITGNRLIASFHQPSNHLKELGSIERVAKYLDAVILICNAQRAYFEEFLPSEKIFVVPHGVDTDFFFPIAKLNEQPICITVGSHLRDFETLKQAINIVWMINPRVQLIAVGTRRDKKYYFGGIEDKRIHFLEKINDEQLREVYQNSRIAIFSFQDATANNALLESMASGLPIVATDVGGIRDYVDNETGILYPQQNPQALADGILKLLDDSSNTTRMAMAARTRALKHDYRIVANHMCMIYEKILFSAFH